MIWTKQKRFEEAINTLNAGWLEIKLAKLFGKKISYREDHVTVIVHRWRNKVYLTDVIKGDSK